MIFWGLLACFSSHEEACIASCQDKQAFWEACYDTIQSEGFYIDCYSNTEALGESLAAAGSDSSARFDVYNSWMDEGYVSSCESASDVTDNCVNLIQAEFPHMSTEAAEERGKECREEDTSAIGEAIKNLDCQGFLTAFGM